MLYFSVALFDHAVQSAISGTGTVFFIYCIFVGLWVCMVHGGFMGVKKNDAALLGRANFIGVLFCVLFCTISLSFVFGCGMECGRRAIFWASAHARKLRGKVLEGAKLTRLVSEPSQVT